jgi:hypothetical protein
MFYIRHTEREKLRARWDSSSAIYRLQDVLFLLLRDVFGNTVIELVTFVTIVTLIKLIHEIYGRYRLTQNDLTQRDVHGPCFPASVQMAPLGWCRKCVEGLILDETHQLMVCHNDEREHTYIYQEEKYRKSLRH